MAVKSRRRHYRQRFDPAAPMVFRRPVRTEGTTFGVGEPVPPEWSVPLLRRLWRAERVEQALFTPPGADKSVAADTFIDRVVKAILEMDPENGKLWLTDGRPDLKPLQKQFREPVTAAVRDQAWEQARAIMLKREEQGQADAEETA